MRKSTEKELYPFSFCSKSNKYRTAKRCTARDSLCSPYHTKRASCPAAGGWENVSTVYGIPPVRVVKVVIMIIKVYICMYVFYMPNFFHLSTLPLFSVSVSAIWNNSLVQSSRSNRYVTLQSQYLTLWALVWFSCVCVCLCLFVFNCMLILAHSSNNLGSEELKVITRPNC